MKIYIAGKITGQPNYKELFSKAEQELKAKGHSIMNPAILEGKEFEHKDFMYVCYAMIDVCDKLYFLNNWEDSIGAKLEHDYAVGRNKLIEYQPKE